MSEVEPFVVEDDPIRVPLRSQDGTVVAHALIDAADESVLAGRRWCLTPDGYVHRRETPPGGRSTAIYLHRAVLGLVKGDGWLGDHIDGDRLNCRRANLRVVTLAQNAQNIASRGASSTHRGVCWDARRAKWMARAQNGGRTVNLGRFDDELEAAAVASAARLRFMTHTNEERAA